MRRKRVSLFQLYKSLFKTKVARLSTRSMEAATQPTTYFASKKARRRLTRLNIFAATVHLVDGVLGVLLIQKGNPQVEAIQPLKNFETKGSNAADVFSPKSRTVFSVGVFIEPVAVEFITFFFHLLYILLLNSSAFRLFTQKYIGGGGLNPWRWIEYSITASLMSSFGALNIGIDSFPYFVTLLSSGVALQLCGYIIETLDCKVPKDVNLFHIIWMQGTFLNLTNVGILLYQLFGSSTHTTVFYYNILPFTILFQTFGFVARCSFFKWRNFKDDAFTEESYVILSLTTKVAVFWLGFATFRELVEQRGFVERTQGVRWDVVRWVFATVPLAFVLCWFVLRLSRKRTIKRREPALLKRIEE